MTIKTTDGVENVASNGLGNTAVTLGAIGTGLGILNGGLGILGNRNQMANNDPDANFVTRHELNLVQQLQAKDIALASKDAELSLCKSEAYTDSKMVEVYKATHAEVAELEKVVNANRIAQDAVNAQQGVFNATANGVMSSLQTQVQSLQSIARMMIPSSNICETSCCGCSCNQ